MKPKTGTWNREGRANPREILYIYLAKDPRTAMAEVRPWIGAKISIGEFQLTKEVRLVNCSKYHDSMRQILQDSQANYVDGAWLAIDRAFAKPVTREDDDIANYIPTQIIAEAFRTQGYDGVLPPVSEKLPPG